MRDRPSPIAKVGIGGRTDARSGIVREDQAVRAGRVAGTDGAGDRDIDRLGRVGHSGRNDAREDRCPAPLKAELLP